MTDPTPTEATQATPEQMDMSMKADANVQWANPDALSREQSIRIGGLNAALTIHHSTFKTIETQQLLDTADEISAWITTGERPTERVSQPDPAADES